MDKIKKYIIISIIVVVIIIIAVILLLIYQDNLNKEKSASDVQKIVTDTNFLNVTDKDTFYQTEDCIQEYYKYLNIDDYTQEEYIPGTEQPFAQQKGINNEEDKNSAILNLLDTKFIQENSIDVNNVTDFIVPIDLDEQFYRATNQQIATGAETSTIYVEGEIINRNTYEIISQVYYIVYVDYATSAFSIYPLERDTDDLNQYIDDVKIERNDNNYVGTVKLTDEDMAFKYFSDFKNSAMKKTDYAFSKLEEQYRQNRFSNDKSQFDSYIDKNADELRGLTINKYSINTYDDYTEYVCMDKYENYYIFRVTDFTEYTVILDNYTIMTANFKSAYDNANGQGRTMLNCDKCIQMLNNRDYSAAYNVLDETFRNNNFGSVDNFENYMRQNYGEHYDIDFDDFSNEGDTYIQPITLNTISGSGETKEITIIMRLSDNYGFTMSFVM